MQTAGWDLEGPTRPFGFMPGLRTLLGCSRHPNWSCSYSESSTRPVWLAQLHFFHQALPQPFDPPPPSPIGDGCAVAGSPVKTSRLGDPAPSFVI